MQVLGAFYLALAAFQAGICLYGKGGVSSIRFLGAFFCPLLIQQGKDIRNGNTGRATVHAVAAGGAGNAMLI